MAFKRRKREQILNNKTSKEKTKKQSTFSLEIGEFHVIEEERRIFKINHGE